MAKLASKKPKTKTKKVTSISIREHAKKDHSPVWEGCESWPATQFTKYFREAMQYYNLEFSSKDLKPAVVKWMIANEYDALNIDAFKQTKDWRCSSTMGGIASCLLRGMLNQREDFNGGRDVVLWLDEAIARTIAHGQDDIVEATEASTKPVVPPVSIQQRLREASIRMMEELDDAIEELIANPDNFDTKTIKVLNLLKGKQVKAAHARLIKEFYTTEMMDYSELVSGSDDEDLKEGYARFNKKQVKTIHSFYQEILNACEMLMQEAKVTRKIRTKKPIAKDILVSKLKYKKSDELLKLVSINPADIIDAKELWVYNTKNRKLGRYVADALNGPLTVKGTTIVGFNEHTSIQKTLRKPTEKLAEFKAAGKIALRKFLDEINATDTKLSSRIGEDTLILKVAD